MIITMIGLYGILNGWITNIDINLKFMISCNDNNNYNEVELIVTRDNYIKTNTHDDDEEEDNDDDDELEDSLELNEVSISSIENNIQNNNCRIYLSDMISRVISMGYLGLYASFGDFIYGYVFTCMIRYSGLLGYAQQAGLGAAMRGIEWISFCVAEGFLISSITIVGQNIGAGIIIISIIIIIIY